MSARQDDERRVGEMWHAINQLQRRVKEAGITRDMLFRPSSAAEEMMVDGVIYNLQRILEEAVAISDDTKVSIRNVSWNQIRGMRNRLVHDYSGVDFDYVWLAIEEELPLLKRLCLDYCELHGLSVDDLAEDDMPRA